MSDWRIAIPFRHRSEPLTVTAGHARMLGQDENRVTTQLVIQAYTDGLAATAGELLDHLERLEPSGRRAMLDRARVECGLPSTAEAELADPPMRVGAFDRRPMHLEHREGGALVEVYDSDPEERAEQERMRIAATRGRDEQRAAEAEEWRQHELGLAAQLEAELPVHLRKRPR